MALLEEQNRSRLSWLVPIRHARMRESPFAFYRGAARIMAGDLASTPTSGLPVQLCGDAHLANFGAYASPERNLVFDVNDFDETLRGPWEWDLKRLATSFMVAAQHLRFPRAAARKITSASVMAYRNAIRELAALGIMQRWYHTITVESIARAASHDELDVRIDRFERRARGNDSLQALQKLAELVDGDYRIRSDPPLLYALRDLPQELDAKTIDDAAREAFEQYKTTLQDHRRWLLDQFRLVDVGVKVVGVGSVGTRCFVLLLEGRDQNDPLLLQVKEAMASVLEEHLGPSPYDNDGRRVVEGQRLVQAQSDIFLGWTESRGGKQFYLRQLRDWKGTVEIDRATPERLEFYANLCGRTLARGHARSGDPIAITAYCGKSDALERALTAFAEAYAAQNLRDFEAFTTAIAERRLEVAA